MKVRADLVRLYKAVHIWVGITSGLALFVAFYAGALAMFTEPLTAWVQTSGQPQPATPLARTQQLIDKVLAERPEVARRFSIHLAPSAPARMTWQAEGGERRRGGPPRPTFVAALDEAGALTVRELAWSPAPAFIDALHQKVGLPLPPEPAEWVMGVVAALYVLALVSGVIVLLPSLVKDLFAVRVGKNTKRMWLDSHNMLGLLSLPFHLVMALTSVIFAFHDVIYDLEAPVIWRADSMQQVFRRGPPPRIEPREVLPIEQLLAGAAAHLPDLLIAQLDYSIDKASGARQVSAIGADPGHFARGRFASTVPLDPATGAPRAGATVPSATSGLERVLDGIFSVHFGTYGGWPVRWVYFVMGLAGAFVFYSGNLIWVESRRKRARANAAKAKAGAAAAAEAEPAQRRDARLMAAATVGVGLGCVCGCSLLLAAARWLPLLLGPAPELLARVTTGLYYAAFALCIAWAFWRGAARAGWQLLWVAAMATLAIPATTLLGWALPQLGLGRPAGALWLVDAVALLAAAVFTWLARLARRRAAAGAPDSVWAQHTRQAPLAAT